MRLWVTALCLVSATFSLNAQSTSSRTPRAEPKASPGATEVPPGARELPVRKVVLYKMGSATSSMPAR